MKSILTLGLLLLCPMVSAGDKTPHTEDSITVKVIGTLRTGIIAIGGETTGTTITAKKVTWELDFDKNAKLKKAAERLNGKKIFVEGSLERREGVEIKERWIVHVTKLESVGGKKRNAGGPAGAK